MTDVKYDFSGKMKQNREQWSHVGVTTVTLRVPEHYAEYFKAVTNMMTAEALIVKIKEQDDAVIEQFANRQPRLPFSAGDLNTLRDQVSGMEANSDLLERIDDLVGSFRERTDAFVKGNREAEIGNEAGAAYFFAYEYALCIYMRGAWSLINMRLNGLPFPALSKY